MNNRANIMYFIEHLCDMATKENHLPFVNMIQRDIIRVVDAAAPSDGSGAANVKHVRRVLNGLQSKSILSTETVAEIDASLKERERYSEDLLDFKASAGDELQSDESKAGGDILRTASTSKIKVDKRQIEQRIEEDRERNKRLREIIWAAPPNDAGELDAMWDDVSDIGEDDYLQTAEETQERARAAEAAITLD
jgi:CTD kinase subunit gamma